MADNRNTLALKILDTDFSVKAENEAQRKNLLKIEEYVNQELMTIKERNQFVNHIRIAILGCMNITEELFALQDQMQEMAQEREKENARYSTLENQVETLTKDKEEIKTDYENRLQSILSQLTEIKETQSLLEKQLNEKNELLNQYREKLKQSKDENDANRKSILDLQNQLFENQIELVKLSKDAQKELAEAPASEEQAQEEDQELSDIIKALKEQQEA